MAAMRHAELALELDPRERTRMWRELILVVALFALPVFVYGISGAIFGPVGMPDHAGQANALVLAVQGIVIIGLVRHILLLNGETFRLISRPYASVDVFRAIPLLIGYVVASAGTGLAISYAFDVPLVAGRMNYLLLDFSPALLAVVLVNPFVEQIVARGFLQSRLSQLGLGPALVVVISVLVQVGYHAYLGFPAILPLAAGAAVLAVYYQWTRRLWPVIIAHLVVDVIALARLTF
jgi:membrane protease YdiL (CAAX protease family)